MIIHHIYGIHAVKSLLRTQPDRIECLWLQEGALRREEEFLNSALAQGIPILQKTGSDFKKQVQDAVHQGILAVLKQESMEYFESDIPGLLQQTGTDLIVALDGVQDPHNLGALIRSANAFGAGLVLVPKNRAAQVTAVVQKVSCGAASVTPIVTVINLVRVLEKLKEAGFWITGLDGEAVLPLAHIDLTGPQVLVLGSEGEGLRRLTQERCDQLGSIPMQGFISNLNVSVAGGIALYEVQRQRRMEGF